jgi:predicted RNase H-like HicB family nuclease
MIKMSTLTAIIYKDEDLYVAECPQVGTVSQGETIEKALANLIEATELYLEEFPLTINGHPIITTFEITPKEVEKSAKV